MAIVSFSPNTPILSADVNANFNGLADGSLDAVGNSLTTYRDESFFDYIASGIIWTGDSYGVNRNASMTSGVVYVNGKRVIVSAVVARTFTASKDTYVYVSDAGVVSYQEVANNAASPTLTANTILVAIIVTGATTIAASASINQGQVDRVLPIASSIPYSITDSLGNLIANRTPVPSTIGYRQSVTSQSSIGSSPVLVTGLSEAIQVPTGRKVELTLETPDLLSTAISTWTIAIYNSATVTGSPIQSKLILQALAATHVSGSLQIEVSPSAGLQSFCAAISCDTGTGQTTLSSQKLATLTAKLV